MLEELHRQHGFVSSQLEEDEGDEQRNGGGAGEERRRSQPAHFPGPDQTEDQRGDPGGAQDGTWNVERPAPDILGLGHGGETDQCQRDDGEVHPKDR